MPGAQISGKTVLVTGGSRGIGLEWVERLLQQGNTVVATARNPAASEGLQKLAAGEAGARLILAPFEASSADSAAALVEGLKGKVTHVDVLIYNAGVLHEAMTGALADLTPTMLQDTYATNVFGPVYVTQELLKHGLLGGDSPSLAVYTTSIVGSISTLPFAEHAAFWAYRSSKVALNAIVRTLGVQLGAKQQLTTVLMHPGYVDTDMSRAASAGGPAMPGSITTEESVTSMLKILEDGRPIDGRFFSYTGEEVPW